MFHLYSSKFRRSTNSFNLPILVDDTDYHLFQHSRFHVGRISNDNYRHDEDQNHQKYADAEIRKRLAHPSTCSIDGAIDTIAEENCVHGDYIN